MCYVVKCLDGFRIAAGSRREGWDMNPSWSVAVCESSRETILCNQVGYEKMIAYNVLNLSKEVWKLNFRQYGEMEMAQRGRNSDVEKVRREKIRDGEDQRWRKSEERRCRCAKR